jgi:hypothetical protein
MSESKPFTDFSLLRRAVANLGVNIDALTRERLEILWKGEEFVGRESLVTSEEGGGLYEILPDGTVIRLVVHAPKGPSRYGRDGNDEYSLLNDSQMWHKYHIYWCQTLESWSHRLRKTSRNDGKFTYPVFDLNNNEYKPELRDGGRSLNLCRNCIKHIPGGRIPDNYTLEEFLRHGISNTRFTEISIVSDYDQLPNIYPSDWHTISQKFKEMRFWKCEECFIDLSENSLRRYLHSHHRDGRRNHCSVTNLQALCIRCHAGKHPNNQSFQESADLQKFREIFAKINN